MSHYYSKDANLKDNIKQIDVQLFGTSFRFLTNTGVFSKEGLDFGSRLLINNIKLDDKVSSILDMGCGYGPIGIALAKKYNKQVLMADVNTRAIKLAKENIILNNVTNINVVESDLFNSITNKYDCIVSNPPIRTGKQNIFNLYEQAYDYLNDGGFLYVVIQKKQGAPSTYNKLIEVFKNVEVVIKEKGYWLIKACK